MAMTMEIVPVELPVVHVEISISTSYTESLEDLRTAWQQHLGRCDQLREKDCRSSAPSHLQQTCVHLVVEAEHPNTILGGPGPTYVIEVHIYILNQEEANIEELEPTNGDDEWTAACESLSLPNKNLQGLWESLIFESYIGRDLVHFATSSLLFADARVDSSLIGWNRLLLLHGPPGTGKTSLCRALAQKLSIRMRNRFPRTTMLEVASHSLFSKWFSTSGKLIAQVFELVRDLVKDDPQCLVCVILDEIESLASSRSALSTNGEPSDAVRAVNSLLTSIDKLREHPNVLLLATTNLPTSVDPALLDRADLKLYIGLPCLSARYEILRSCVLELVRVGIIKEHAQEVGELMPFKDLPPAIDGVDMQQAGNRLLQVAAQAKGQSGRFLRRLPLKAHALHCARMGRVPLAFFLEALKQSLNHPEFENGGIVDWDESDI